MAKVLMATQCGLRIGFGHLSRCLRLARALSRRGHAVSFFGEGLGEYRGYARSFETADVPRPVDAVVTDLIRPKLLPGLRAILRCGRVISLHDMGLAQFESDFAIDGSVVQAVPYPAGRANIYVGPRYAIIDRPSASALAPRRPTLHLNFGGGDVAGIYRKVIPALESMTTLARARACRGFTRWEPPPSRMVRWIGSDQSATGALRGCRVALCAGGISLYEAAAAGVPALVLSHHRLQERTALEFERRGAAISLGLARHATVAGVRAAVESLLNDAPARRRMSAAGCRIVDGRGLARVTRIVEKAARC